MLLRTVSRIKPPRAWGKTFNSKTDIPIPSAFVKLYNLRNKQLIDTKITDNGGKFQFFVSQDNYLALATATGYKFPSQKTPKEKLGFHDSLLKVEADMGSIDIDIPLDPSTTVSKPMSPFSTSHHIATNASEKLDSPF